MKKLFMNPFASQGKKGHNWGWMLGVAFAVLTFGSCSEENEQIVPVTFPEQQELSCNVNETVELKFKADAEWQLSSSAIWCNFLVNDVESISTSGAAGEQIVTIKANDKAYGHEMSVANITMSMGLRKAVIAKVVRSAQGYELTLLNSNDEEIDFIEVGYKDFTEFKVKANFNFAATNRPSWVELDGGSLVGNDADVTLGKVRVVTDGVFEKYPVTVEDNERITFSDAEGKASFSFPLTFKGMDPEEIDVEGVSSNPWGWTVSLDGKTFSQEGTSGASSETTTTVYKNRLPFTIKALNDDYEIVYVQRAELAPDYFTYWFGPEEEVNWMSFDKKTMTLSVQSSMEEKREGLVFAFPKAVYDVIKDDLRGNMLAPVDPESGMTTQEIKYEYTSNNMLINFVQKENQQAPSTLEYGVKVTYSSVGIITEAPLKRIDDIGIKSEYAPEGKIDDIYSVDKTLSNAFQIDPKMEGEWSIYCCVGKQVVTDKCKIEDGIIKINLNEGADAITIPEGSKLEVIIKDEQGVTKKVVFFE